MPPAADTQTWVDVRNRGRAEPASQQATAEIGLLACGVTLLHILDTIAWKVVQVSKIFALRRAPVIATLNGIVGVSSSADADILPEMVFTLTIIPTGITRALVHVDVTIAARGDAAL